jgi:hypothetical protein
MPNQFLGVLLHTIGISGLSRVRTELFQLLVIPIPDATSSTVEPPTVGPSQPWRSSALAASSGWDTGCAQRHLCRFHPAQNGWIKESMNDGESGTAALVSNFLH